FSKGLLHGVGKLYKRCFGFLWPRLGVPLQALNLPGSSFKPVIERCLVDARVCGSRFDIVPGPYGLNDLIPQFWRELDRPPSGSPSHATSPPRHSTDRLGI